MIIARTITLPNQYLFIKTCGHNVGGNTDSLVQIGAAEQDGGEEKYMHKSASSWCPLLKSWDLYTVYSLSFFDELGLMTRASS